MKARAPSAGKMMVSWAMLAGLAAGPLCKRYSARVQWSLREDLPATALSAAGRQDYCGTFRCRDAPGPANWRPCAAAHAGRTPHPPWRREGKKPPQVSGFRGLVTTAGWR